MALVREIYIGSEKGYRCTISRAIFAEGEHGGLLEARNACLRHAHGIVKQQSLDNVPPNASMKERRKAYRESLPVA